MPSTHTNLTYRIVFSTKSRMPLIVKAWQSRLFDYLGGCLRNADAVLLEAGGASDHVHLLAEMKPTNRVSDVLRDIKKASSDWVRSAIGEPRFYWQEGYGAFSVNGSRCSNLIHYIRNQEEHHRGRSFEEEYRALLVEYGVEYDERYLW